MAERQLIGLMPNPANDPCMGIASSIKLAQGYQGGVGPSYMPTDAKIRSYFWARTHRQPTDEEIARVRRLASPQSGRPGAE